MSPRGSGRSEQSRERALLERLSAALSTAELERVLAGALLVLDAAGRRRLFERLGSATGRTLQQLLGPAGHAPPRASQDKILEEWQRAWWDWDECLAEAAHEEGKYIVQDYDWEAPYLAATELAGDLEPIAQRMRKLIEPVWQHDLDPDLSFSGAIAAAALEIGSGLPEWMDCSDGCDFGPEVTRCLLEWEWSTARTGREAAFDLIDSICALDVSLTRASLHYETIAGFIFELSEADQRAILAGISASAQQRHWAEVLQQPHGGWFYIYHKLTQRWETET